MKKKELTAISKFSAVKDSREPLNGITVDFSEGILYACNRYVLVKAKYPELQQNGPKVIIPIKTVQKALKSAVSEIAITPTEIGGISYQPVEGDPPDFDGLIQENDKPGILPWCKPENIMRVEKLAEALETSYLIRLPENLNGPVRFDYAFFGYEAISVTALVLGDGSTNNMLNWRKF